MLCALDACHHRKSCHSLRNPSVAVWQDPRIVLQAVSMLGMTSVRTKMMCLLRWIICALQVFDDFLQQLGEDTAAYVRTVCQTIVLTVPKAVIHCQVCSPLLLTSVFLLLTILLLCEALTMIHSKTPAFQQHDNICSPEETGQTALQYRLDMRSRP